MDVALKAKAAAVDVGENYSIVAIAGGWHDDGDGTPEDAGSTDDSYVCWGLATGSVTIKAG